MRIFFIDSKSLTSETDFAGKQKTEFRSQNTAESVVMGTVRREPFELNCERLSAF